MSLKIFGNAFDNLSGVLDLRMMRHNLLISNLTNMDTPGYKARDVDFAGELRKRIGSTSPVELKTTSPNHFPAANSLKGPVPKVIMVPGGEGRLDGNTVELDREMAKISENQTSYVSLLEIIKRRMSLIKFAIQGG